MRVHCFTFDPNLFIRSEFTTTLTELKAIAVPAKTGFIDGKMVKRHLENEQEAFFYVSGPPAFNEAMEKMLLEELKIRGEMILIENFSGY